jgi:hypothetical protein
VWCLWIRLGAGRAAGGGGAAGGGVASVHLPKTGPGEGYRLGGTRINNQF